MRKPNDNEVMEVPRDRLEKVAHIVGPESAAAKALADADAHDGPVRFFLTDRATIIVEKMVKEIP